MAGIPYHLRVLNFPAQIDHPGADAHQRRIVPVPQLRHDASHATIAKVVNTKYHQP